MTSRSKLSQPNTNTNTNTRPQSQTILPKPKTNLKTQSTFLNSYNSSSKQKMDNDKAAKVIYKMQRNLDHLKKVCNISSKPQPTVSSREMMAVAELQSYYTLIHGKSTDNIQKLYKFYTEHFIPNGSSSSSGGSSTCRINKRKTVQDLRINESPLKNNQIGKGIGIKSRRGSEASKINRKQIVEKEEKNRIKTELSNKNLRGFQFMPQINKNSNKSSNKNINTKIQIDIRGKDQSKQKQRQKSNKKKIKSILKKPSFDLSANKQIKIKTVRGSIPTIFTKLYQNQKADKYSSSRSKQTFKSPRHNPNPNPNPNLKMKSSHPPNPSQLSLTNKTLAQECQKSLSKSSKRSTQISKYKLLKKPQNYKLNDLLDDINQLSPINDQPPPSIRLKEYK